MIGSAAALGPEDVITCQYRETGMFLQRGFTLKDFMSQLTANHNDPGKGRNMPVHYSGKLKVGAVRTFASLCTLNLIINGSSMPSPPRSEHKSPTPQAQRTP
jgi:2-oxoisovalerate dehydrogenase E1 component alpha subunit